MVHCLGWLMHPTPHSVREIVDEIHHPDRERGEELSHRPCRHGALLRYAEIDLRHWRSAVGVRGLVQISLGQNSLGGAIHLQETRFGLWVLTLAAMGQGSSSAVNVVGPTQLAIFDDPAPAAFFAISKA